jgi:hypothetical protein
MDKVDRQKLTAAGFTLLRVHAQKLQITYMNANGNTWRIMAQYDNMAALKRKVKEIDENDKMKIFEFKNV